MIFVAAPSHPLMRRKRVGLKDLEAAHLLVRERGAGTRTTVENLFKASGHKFHIGSELSSNEAIKQMAEAGLGVAFLSLHACALELRAGLLGQLPFPGNPIVREWYVVTLADRRISPVTGLFRDFLIELGAPVMEGVIAKPHERHRT
jgi:DNA-binding transcriptional LysR family regulator